MPRHLSWRWVTVSLVASLVLRAAGTEYVWQTNDIDYPSDEMRLQGDVMWDVTNTRLVAQCAAECLKHDDCRSFNFIRERRLCELSNSTHADPGAKLQSDPLSSYFTRDTFDVQQVGKGFEWVTSASYTVCITLSLGKIVIYKASINNGCVSDLVYP